MHCKICLHLVWFVHPNFQIKPSQIYDTQKSKADYVLGCTSIATVYTFRSDNNFVLQLFYALGKNCILNFITDN